MMPALPASWRCKKHSPDGGACKKTSVIREIRGRFLLPPLLRRS